MMPNEMSYKQASEASSGFRRGGEKGTGIEGVVSGIVGLLSDYAEFLEPISNAISDIIKGGADAQKPESIKEAVERYITLPESKDESGIVGASILGGGMK